MTKPLAVDDRPEEFEDSLDSFVGNEDPREYAAPELVGQRIPPYRSQPEGWGLND
jgi:hypothetical protein